MAAIKPIDYRKLDQRQTEQPKEHNEDFYASRPRKGLAKFFSGLDKKTKIELVVLGIALILTVVALGFYFSSKLNTNNLQEIFNNPLYNKKPPVYVEK